jgi:hypothetical protein
MQLDGGFDDALAGGRLGFGAALQGVSAGHGISLHDYVHPY